MERSRVRVKAIVILFLVLYVKAAPRTTRDVLEDTTPALINPTSQIEYTTLGDISKDESNDIIETSSIYFHNNEETTEFNKIENQNISENVLINAVKSSASIVGEFNGPHRYSIMFNRPDSGEMGQLKILPIIRSDKKIIATTTEIPIHDTTTIENNYSTTINDDVSIDLSKETTEIPLLLTDISNTTVMVDSLELSETTERNNYITSTQNNIETTITTTEIPSTTTIKNTAIKYVKIISDDNTNKKETKSFPFNDSKDSKIFNIITTIDDIKTTTDSPVTSKQRGSLKFNYGSSSIESTSKKNDSSDSDEKENYPDIEKFKKRVEEVSKRFQSHSVPSFRERDTFPPIVRQLLTELSTKKKLDTTKTSNESHESDDNANDTNYTSKRPALKYMTIQRNQSIVNNNYAEINSTVANSSEYVNGANREFYEKSRNNTETKANVYKNYTTIIRKNPVENMIEDTTTNLPINRGRLSIYSNNAFKSINKETSDAITTTTTTTTESVPQHNRILVKQGNYNINDKIKSYNDSAIYVEKPVEEITLTPITTIEEYTFLPRATTTLSPRNVKDYTIFPRGTTSPRSVEESTVFDRITTTTIPPKAIEEYTFAPVHTASRKVITTTTTTTTTTPKSIETESIRSETAMRGKQKYVPSKFETISPFISDSHVNQLFKDSGLSSTGDQNVNEDIDRGALRFKIARPTQIRNATSSSSRGINGTEDTTRNRAESSPYGQTNDNDSKSGTKLVKNRYQIAATVSTDAAESGAGNSTNSASHKLNGSNDDGKATRINYNNHQRYTDRNRNNFDAVRGGSKILGNVSGFNNNSENNNRIQAATDGKNTVTGYGTETNTTSNDDGKATRIKYNNSQRYIDQPNGNRNSFDANRGGSKILGNASGFNNNNEANTYNTEDGKNTVTGYGAEMNTTSIDDDKATRINYNNYQSNRNRNNFDTIRGGSASRYNNNSETTTYNTDDTRNTITGFGAENDYNTSNRIKASGSGADLYNQAPYNNTVANVLLSKKIPSRLNLAESSSSLPSDASMLKNVGIHNLINGILSNQVFDAKADAHVAHVSSTVSPKDFVLSGSYKIKSNDTVLKISNYKDSLAGPDENRVSKYTFDLKGPSAGRGPKKIVPSRYNQREENEIDVKKKKYIPNQSRGSIKYKWDPKNPEWIDDDDDGGDFPSQFSYNYQTANGISASQKGVLKAIDNKKVFVITGSYQYISPDGTPIYVTYTADEHGFHPKVTSPAELMDLPKYGLDSLEFPNNDYY